MRPWFPPLRKERARMGHPRSILRPERVGAPGAPFLNVAFINVGNYQLSPHFRVQYNRPWETPGMESCQRCGVAMQSAWIGVIGGLAGVLTGSALTELLRRANRIESYASHVFDKRMQVHEQLFSKIVSARSVAEEVIGGGEASSRGASCHRFDRRPRYCRVLRRQRAVSQRGVDSALRRFLDGGPRMSQELKIPKNVSRRQSMCAQI